MSDIWVAIIVSLILTIPISIIQIYLDSKRSNLWSYLSWIFFIFLFLKIIFNAATTYLAALTIENIKDVPFFIKIIYFVEPKWILYSLLGLFGFEVILKEIDVTYSEKNILSFNSWMTVTKKSATAAVIEKDITLKIELTERLSEQLSIECSASQINAHAINILGMEKLKEINDSLNSHTDIEIDRIKYLSIILSDKEPEKINAILKAKKKSKSKLSE